MMPIREFVEGVTFREFRELAARVGWTAPKLAAELKGKFGGPVQSDFYERPLTYFDRVLSPDRHTEETVIPYRCVVELYMGTTRLNPAHRTNQIVTRRCACGCGSATWGSRRYAARTCQRRGPAPGLTVEDHEDDGHPDGIPFGGVPEGLATRDMASERVIDPEYLAPWMSRVPPAQTSPLCEECGGGFSWSGKGPRPRHCGARCRKRAERRRLRSVG